MRTLSAKVLLGFFLTGCTVNNLKLTSVDYKSIPEIVVIETTRPVELEARNVDPKPEKGTVVSEAKIRPECELYVPLPVPQPKRINFKELDAATTSKEINGIALKNVKELHQQLLHHGEAQRRHYDDYKKRCVLK